MTTVRAKTGLSTALAGEWAKARSWPAGRVLAGLALAATVIGSVGFVATTPITTGKSLLAFSPHQRLTISMMGVDVANIVMIVASVLFVSNENSSRLVELTVQAIPRRANIVLAKLLVCLGVGTVISAISSLLAFFSGRAVMIAQGVPLESMLDGEVIRMLLGIVVMIPVHVALGVAFAYMTTSGLLAFLAVFGVMCLPTLATLLPAELSRSVHWLLITPAIHTIAGISLPGTADYTQPLSAVAILAAWIGIAISSGIARFRARDI